MGQFDSFLGFGSSGYDADPYNALGTGAAVVPDVAWSSPPMETSTATGNGFGDFFDSKLGNFTLNGLNTALNYAMYRDQRQFQAVANAPQQAVQQQVAIQQVRNNNLLLWVAIAGGLIFLVKR
ncbi:hypothetical protein [Janthinobacterium sp.]|uniref:hypothetical protein n=1 Tax=Janthinobacterium sp. TaxID=1871054 RepID=UPI00263218E3|nr:hypothetical protein [Janthinobacterium sp.]